jgi:hypothetical protein
MNNHCWKNTVKVFLFFMASVYVMAGCKKGQSINDFYNFPATKDVMVQVNINYLSTVNGQVNPDLNFTGRKFTLNAFALDAEGEQVQMALNGSEPDLDLPVTLSSTQTNFDVMMRLPVYVKAGPDGYALRFTLKDASAALTFASNETSDLDALRGDVKAGAAAADNNVELSIATSLAYRIVAEATNEFHKQATRTAYNDIVALLKERQTELETEVDTATKHDASAYAIGMKVRLGLEIVTDKTFQSKIITSSLTAALDGVTAEADKDKIASKFADAFTRVLVESAQAAKDRLTDPNAATVKVWKVDPTGGSLPDPDEIEGAAFAPANVAFTDTDSSSKLGGNIVINAPLVNRGITSYNVYFGGETRTSSKISLIQNVKPAADGSIVLSLPSGTDQVTSSTRFWVYPVANETELNLPASVVINNVGGTSNVAPAPTGVAVTAGILSNSLSWNAVTGATGYNIYWSTTNPVTTSDQKISNVTSPHTHSPLTPAQAYYYIVTAVKNGVEGLPSSQVTATPSALSQVAITGSSFTSGRLLVEFSFPISNGSLTLTATNNGTDQVNFTSPTTGSLGLSGNWSLTGGTCASVSSLAAGASCTLDLTYSVTTAGEFLTQTVTLAYTTAGGLAGSATKSVTGATYCFNCRLFVTASTFDGNLGGISGADSKCMSDGNYPGNGVFKAMITDNLNRKSDVGSQVNWPLGTNSTFYRRPDTIATHPIFTTDGDGVNKTTFSYAPGENNTRNVDIWTGITNVTTSWSSSTDNCSGWSSNSVGLSGVIGNSLGDYSSGSNSGNTPTVISSGTSACNLSRAIYCVEQ